MIAIIYLITNTATGKAYVGVTRQRLDRRWRGHVHSARKGVSTALGAAIRKHGEGAFVIEPVATCMSSHMAGAAERDFIRQYGTKAPNGYNLTDGGDGVAGLPREVIERTAAKNRGRKHSTATKYLISVAGMGRTKSAKAKEAISKARLGKPLSSDHRAKLSMAKRGRRLPPRTADHCAKISEGLVRAHACRRLSRHK